jgi:hypothetical protein
VLRHYHFSDVASTDSVYSVNERENLKVSGTKFDDQMSRKVEALYSTPDAVAQRKRVLDAWFAEKPAAD